MIYTINLLNQQSIDKILKIYDLAPFKQGLMSNPNNKDEKRLKTEVKNVLQMDDTFYQKECYDVIYGHILKSQEFHDYTCPKSYDGVNILEYKPGMKYNMHNDHYMMGKIRADMSCTVFLNPAEEYEGGELVLTVGNQEIPYKLNSGECVIYPTGLKHKVNEVISGSRKVIVFWIESCIQDMRVRALYQELVVSMNNNKEYISDNPDLLNDLISVKYNMLRNFASLS